MSQVFYGRTIVAVGFLAHIASAFSISSTLRVFLKPLGRPHRCGRGDRKSSIGSLYICRYGYSHCFHCFDSGWIAHINSRLLLWIDGAVNLISLHMLLGLLAVGALWVIGIGQFFSRSGSGIIAACALIVGAVMIAVGLYQSSLMAGEFHRAIQVIHAPLGLFTIGASHMGAAR
jgi:hypothetical protein